MEKNPSLWHEEVGNKLNAHLHVVRLSETTLLLLISQGMGNFKVVMKICFKTRNLFEKNYFFKNILNKIKFKVKPP
jgi:hypothetical protein